MKDYLELYVKKGKAKQIISRYALFGWKLEQSRENENYVDLVDLTFSRNHNIANKDDLQLLQVYMEEKINETAKEEHRLHAKSTSVGLTLGLLGIALVTLGILFFAEVFAFNIMPAIILLSSGVSLLILNAILVSVLFKRETRKFIPSHQTKLNELELICKKAGELTGGNNG